MDQGEKPKLTAQRCRNLGDSARDDVLTHVWKPETHVEATEGGPVAWWLCAYCAARTLYDAETLDGFAVEPIVVYPTSCFEGERFCGCPRRAGGDVEHLEGCVDDQAVTEALARQAGTIPDGPTCDGPPCTCGAGRL